MIHRDNSHASAEPAVGQQFRLPSSSVVEVCILFSIAPQVGCRYLQAPWPQNRNGVRAVDGDLILSTDFLERHGRPLTVAP